MTKPLLMNTSSYFLILNLAVLISFKLCASETLLEEVCRATRDQAFCMNVLGSDPRTQYANLYDLGLITIDLGAYSAQGTKVKIHSLFLSEKDPRLRSCFFVCDDFYSHVISCLGEAVGHIKRGEYTDLNVEGGLAYNDAHDCESAFEIPPGYKSPLTDENYHLEMLSEIIISIANLLDRGSLPE